MHSVVTSVIAILKRNALIIVSNVLLRHCEERQRRGNLFNKIVTHIYPRSFQSVVNLRG